MQHPIVRNDPRLFSNERESLYFDRKSARLNAKEVARHICAFANASGGKLVIGIEDNGEIRSSLPTLAAAQRWLERYLGPSLTRTFLTGTEPALPTLPSTMTSIGHSR